MYYYLHRWYDPSIGRFISPDPKQGKRSNPQTLNLYIYVLDQPTTLTDPSGEWGWNPFQAVSNWWNGLSSSQQAEIYTIAVDAAAVGAVALTVATAGAASPLAVVAIGAAVGASASTTVYTVSQGSKANIVGAVGATVSGAISGAIGGGAGAAVGVIAGSLTGTIGGTAASAVGFFGGAVIAGAGADIGDLTGTATKAALGGDAFSVNGNQLGLDFGVSALTFGIGQKLGVGQAADELVAARTANSAGDVTLGTWISGTAPFWEASGLKVAWEAGSNYASSVATTELLPLI